jgi:hypothetical protein
MNYVYTASSLSKEFCEDIIYRYDKETDLKYHGVTAMGMDKSVKDTQDMIIPETDEWDKINQELTKELEKHVKLYIKSIETEVNYKKENNFGRDYHHLQEKLIQVNNFMIQRYEQNKGKYVYHHDGSNESKQSRAITYLWYLNDVVDGGETDFFGGTFHVKPEKGKLLLFPACWCYPHRGNMPISSSKYIVTGWLYTENKKSTSNIPKIAFSEKVTDTLVSDLTRVSEKKTIFDYFYKVNSFLFNNYKENRESLFVPFMLSTYTPLMTSWIKKKLHDVTERTKMDDLNEIYPFVISSFKILVDHIKEHLHIECHFNIKEWYVLYNETESFDLVYDVCIQTDLSTGDSHISTKYKELSGYQLVYFIEFTFHYVDSQNEKKVLTLPEIVDPCLNMI